MSVDIEVFSSRFSRCFLNLSIGQGGRTTFCIQSGTGTPHCNSISTTMYYQYDSVDSKMQFEMIQVPAYHMMYPYPGPGESDASCIHVATKSMQLGPPVIKIVVRASVIFHYIRQSFH